MSEAPVYVPIVKGKQFDILATKELDSTARAKLMPLIEAMPADLKKSALDEHIVKFCDRIRKHLPKGRLFVDFRGIDPEATVDGGVNAILFGFQLLKMNGRPVTPVYGLARNDALWAKLGEIAQDFNQGFCFRLTGDDLDDFAVEDTWEQIVERTADIGLPFGRVDILVDFGSITATSLKALHEKVVAFLHYNPEAYKFRTIIIAGSSALKDVSGIDKEGTQDVRRRELDLWRRLWIDLPEGVRPVFSDYGIVHPDFSDIGANPYINAKIRYTAGSIIRYFRGHGLRLPVNDYAQYRGLAAKVRNSSLYVGTNASFGDRYIDECANYITSTPGAPGTWVKADMNSHMSHTVAQMVEALAELESQVAIQP